MPMIDALVYSSAAVTSDSAMLASCIPNGPDRIQVNEDANAAKLTESIRRCGPSRRSGTAFALGAPSPGNPNGCP